MSDMDRRHLLRIAAPAVALPMVATTAQAKEVRLVTRDEIMDAFRFFDAMELRAEDLNLRYQILIDMLFETNPENLRAKLQQLIDARKDRMVIVDASTATTAPFDPSMYDEMGRLNTKRERAAREMVELGRKRVDEELAPVQEQLEQAYQPAFGGWFGTVLPKPKLRTRIAAWLLGWRA